MKNNSEKEQSISQKVEFNKIFWPLYLLNSFQGLAYGSLIVLVAPLSQIFWPGDEIHSLEMGILFSALAWASAVGGLFFGRLIDRYSRKKILIVISVFRGLMMFLLGFGVEGGGLSTWFYFLILISIFGFFSGGTWPAVISLSNDVVPRIQRSRFFGVYEIIRNTTNIIGWLLATFIVQLGYWRFFFSGMGILIFITLVLFAYITNEPKRGAQQEELFHILKYDDIDYDFQINKEMVRKTMLSKTNIVALIEGIFTWILISSLNFLILNFIQNPPYNISEFSTAVFIVIFGLSGGLVGQLVLARLSDKLADKNYLYRLPIIVISIIVGLITFAIFFYLPFQSLTEEQGQNVLFLLTLPVMWWMGLLYFISRSFFSLYVVNQSPVLQQINLPEAQGTITSWNQFLESFGRGIGPALCGVLLAFTGKNFQLTVMFIIICILPGIILWTIALKWYPNDRKKVKEILEERAKDLKRNKFDAPSRRLIKP